MLKPINQQVIFITGATSSIGLATLRLALDQGAKIFMVDTNENELQKIQDEMRRKNLPTAYAIADMSEADQLTVASDQCIATFGTIDTWINTVNDNHEVRLLDSENEQARGLFEANFWGPMSGSKVAVNILRLTGGAIINVGGSPKALSLSLQPVASAADEALKGYISGLRKELAAEKAAISLTLIQPSDRLLHDLASKILKSAEHAPSFLERVQLPKFNSWSGTSH